MKLTGLRVRSWAAFGTYVGGLGALLGPTLAVLSRSWAYVGGLGPLLGPKLAVLAALGAYVGGLGTRSGRKAAQTLKSEPNPSGSRVPKGSGPHRPPEGPGPGTYFFCRYVYCLAALWLVAIDRNRGRNKYCKMF